MRNLVASVLAGVGAAIFLSAGAPAWAQAGQSAIWTVDPGSPGEYINGRFTSPGVWNPDGDFACATRQTGVELCCQTSPCAGRSVDVNFSLDAGMPCASKICSNDSHSYQYQITGGPGPEDIDHWISYDGNGPFNINNGTYMFDMSGGDRLKVDTTGVGLCRRPNVPAMGRFGAIVALSLLSLAMLLVLRLRGV